MSDNILWYLEKFNLFEKLGMSCLSELGKKSSMVKYKKSDAIFIPDELQKNIFFLKKGKVKVSTYNKEGEELIKTILKPGEMFGKLPYSPGSEDNDYAFAMEECTVCFMPSDEFEKLIQTDAGLSAEVMKFVGMRLQKLERRVERLSFKDSKSRLIEMILDFKEDFGKRVGDEYFIEQTLSHKEIASLIATSRQTVTKLLNELREKELIDFNRKKLIIRDYKGLKAELVYKVM
ncbi:MAG: Crp/Fnr family transcriptional regulator [Ignavibacteriae bacterium HGW-Ignavibacteriae-4]|jgi:CRP-like cAMP-binding protein|nr:MAG: Crp/Fnr family transcriptional regulator [Ignavibacteriae bacterium HGW-Ignavibacteriae-4]